MFANIRDIAEPGLGTTIVPVVMDRLAVTTSNAAHAIDPQA